jgi:hypothetical protein
MTMAGAAPTGMDPAGAPGEPSMARAGGEPGTGVTGPAVEDGPSRESASAIWSMAVSPACCDSANPATVSWAGTLAV